MKERLSTPLQRAKAMHLEFFNKGDHEGQRIMEAAISALSESERSESRQCKRPDKDNTLCTYPHCDCYATPSAGASTSDEREFIATMASEYGPEAGEAVAAFLSTRSATGASVTPKEIVELAKEMYLTAIGDRGYNLTITFARVEAISKALLKIAAPDWLETVTKKPADRRGVQK